MSTPARHPTRYNSDARRKTVSAAAPACSRASAGACTRAPAFPLWPRSQSPESVCIFLLHLLLFLLSPGSAAPGTAVEPRRRARRQDDRRSRRRRAGAGRHQCRGPEVSRRAGWRRHTARWRGALGRARLHHVREARLLYQAPRLAPQASPPGASRVPLPKPGLHRCSEWEGGSRERDRGREREREREIDIG